MGYSEFLLGLGGSLYNIHSPRRVHFLETTVSIATRRRIMRNEVGIYQKVSIMLTAISILLSVVEIALTLTN